MGTFLAEVLSGDLRYIERLREKTIRRPHG